MNEVMFWTGYLVIGVVIALIYAKKNFLEYEKMELKNGEFGESIFMIFLTIMLWPFMTCFALFVGALYLLYRYILQYPFKMLFRYFL